MLLAFALLVLGVLMPFAMVLNLFESTLLSNFVAYLASVAGLAIGVYGVILSSRTNK